MLAQIISKDLLAQFLLNVCNLTPTQVDTLLCDYMGSKRNESLRERVTYRDGGPVEPGSFVRTRAQALKNFRGAVASLVLAAYLGILSMESIEGLAKVLQVVGRLRDTALSVDQSREVVSIIQDLLEKILQQEHSM